MDNKHMDGRYLFRAQREKVEDNLKLEVQTKEVWVYGGITINADGEMCIQNEVGVIVIEPGTQGQCTGLSAKNGLTFDGDVIEISGTKYEIVHIDDEAKFVLVCEEGKHHPVRRKDIEISEIIGKVHDNPELRIYNKL